MKIVRSGSAAWSGGIKDGKGSISTESGALQDYPYGFASRFEGQPGSNPEELIAAAHSACFTMALSLILGEAGLKADRMDTSAKVSLEQVEGRLRHHRLAPDPEGQNPRRRPGPVRGIGRQGQGRLPGLEAAEGRDHPRRQPDRIGSCPASRASPFPGGRDAGRSRREPLQLPGPGQLAQRARGPGRDGRRPAVDARRGRSRLRGLHAQRGRLHRRARQLLHGQRLGDPLALRPAPRRPARLPQGARRDDPGLRRLRGQSPVHQHGQSGRRRPRGLDPGRLSPPRPPEDPGPRRAPGAGRRARPAGAGQRPRLPRPAPSGSSACGWRPSTGTVRSTSSRASPRPRSPARSRRCATGSPPWRRKTSSCASASALHRRSVPEADELVSWRRRLRRRTLRRHTREPP